MKKNVCKALNRICKWGRTCLLLLWIFVQWRFYICKTLLRIFTGPHNQEVKCLFGLYARQAILIGMNGCHLCIWYLILLVSTLDASCLTGCCWKFLESPNCMRVAMYDMYNGFQIANIKHVWFYLSGAKESVSNSGSWGLDL